jgi:hypothetical protein
MSSSDRRFSAEDAEVVARKHLESLGLAAEIANRAVCVRHEWQTFKVIFTPPPGVRAGSFTITVGAGGNIIEQKFER